MPLHDWTRVPAYAFHDFHTAWLLAVRNALNRGVLPAGYYARAEQVVGDTVPDVITLQSRPTNGHPAPSVGNPAAERLVVATAPPRVRVTAACPAEPRLKQLAVRHTSEDAVVALIELVSPGNKSGRVPFQTFVDKVVRAVAAGVHVLLIDPFPPGPRDPDGIHGAIWPELGGAPFTPPEDKPLTLAAYEAGDDGPRCYVEPVAAGDRLIDMPLFLEPGEYVKVPLEAAYQAAWADVLPQDRAALEGVTG
jgi:hypothetical protein